MLSLPKTYKYRPHREVVRILAKEIEAQSGFLVEIIDLSPKIHVVNQTDVLKTGRRGGGKKRHKPERKRKWHPLGEDYIKYKLSKIEEENVR